MKLSLKRKKQLLLQNKMHRLLLQLLQLQTELQHRLRLLLTELPLPLLQLLRPHRLPQRLPLRLQKLPLLTLKMLT